VSFIPERLREWWRTGIRDRLWGGRLGAWLAKRLGAPEKSRAIGTGAFRATEVALGVAAVDLFNALPASHRDELRELPAVIEALEARAAAARAEIDALASAPAAQGDVLAVRRDAAKKQLGETVAALEGIRIDLLRLHAGSTDLQPITTLLNAAQMIGEDVHRLADAQREAEAAMRRSAEDRASG
jgi:serine/threonine-protein kinase